MKNKFKKIPFLLTSYRYTKYIIARYIIDKKYKPYKVHQSVTLHTPIKKGISFFGYYNISPWNENNEILFCSTKREVRRASQGELLNINLIDRDGNIKYLTSTKAWNWQQGCNVQWLGGKRECIIFNDYASNSDQYIAKIYNTKLNKIEKILSFPVYAVSSDGKYALTLNFDRLRLMRPDYAYFNKKYLSKIDNFNDSTDGVYKINLETNKMELLVSLERIKNISFKSTMNNSIHKVNHIDISPDDNYFMFLHRWQGEYGRFTRLIVSDIKGDDIRVLSDNGMVSHCCWHNNDIISFAKTQNGKDRYIIYKDLKEEENVINDPLYYTDGHPSVSPCGKWMITDTYPNNARMSKLLLMNLERGKTIIVGEFFQPLKYMGEMRVDLHPKWSKCGNFISIDSAHNGYRQFHYLNISKIKAMF